MTLSIRQYRYVANPLTICWLCYSNPHGTLEFVTCVTYRLQEVMIFSCGLAESIYTHLPTSGNNGDGKQAGEGRRTTRENDRQGFVGNR